MTNPPHSSRQPPANALPANPAMVPIPPAAPPLSPPAGAAFDLSGSLILRAATRGLIPVLLLLSIIVLFQGHNKPGGGFIAGLMVGSCIVLYSFAFGPVATRRLLRIDPRTLIGFGLFLAFFSLFVPLWFHKPLMTSVWGKIPLPGMEPFKLGTPVLFDLGVFHLVAGVAAEMILSLQRRAYVDVDTSESLIGPSDTSGGPDA